MFEDDRTDAVIFVDARNAFSSLNHQAALCNIRVICPQVATILVNTYRIPASLIILGASDIYSFGGTTQANNLAMVFYALGTTTLVHMLQITSPEVCQVCLAEDISGAGSLGDKVTKWCNELHRLADFGNTQPHAAYSAFRHTILSQYTYFLRMILGMHELIKPVDDVIRLELLPALLNSIVTEVDSSTLLAPVTTWWIGNSNI